MGLALGTWMNAPAPAGPQQRPPVPAVDLGEGSPFAEALAEVAAELGGADAEAAGDLCAAQGSEPEESDASWASALAGNAWAADLKQRIVLPEAAAARSANPRLRVPAPVTEASGTAPERTRTALSPDAGRGERSAVRAIPSRAEAAETAPRPAPPPDVLAAQTGSVAGRPQPRLADGASASSFSEPWATAVAVGPQPRPAAGAPGSSPAEPWATAVAVGAQPRPPDGAPAALVAEPKVTAGGEQGQPRPAAAPWARAAVTEVQTVRRPSVPSSAPAVAEDLRTAGSRPQSARPERVLTRVPFPSAPRADDPTSDFAGGARSVGGAPSQASSVFQVDGRATASDVEAGGDLTPAAATGPRAAHPADAEVPEAVEAGSPSRVVPRGLSGGGAERLWGYWLRRGAASVSAATTVEAASEAETADAPAGSPRVEGGATARVPEASAGATPKVAPEKLRRGGREEVFVRPEGEATVAPGGAQGAAAGLVEGEKTVRRDRRLAGSAGRIGDEKSNVAERAPADAPRSASGANAPAGERALTEPAAADGQTATRARVLAERAETSPAQQVAGALRLQLSRGRERITVRLEPESLGKVELVLERAQGGVSAHLRVETREVQQALSAEVPVLRQAMEARGVTVAEVVVDLGDGKNGSGTGQPRKGSRQRRAAPELSAGPVRAESTAAGASRFDARV